MIYTKDNIQGLMFRLRGYDSFSTVFIIDDYDKFKHVHPCSKVRGHSTESMIAYLDSGHWIPIDKQVINNNYEIY